MKFQHLIALAAALPAALSASVCLAQEREPRLDKEPAVQHTVIEDEGSRIEELRVRGQTQRITVTTKQGGKSSYQIITSDGSRELTVGPGATGKSVWSVLSF
jgi:hypothetical protein